MPTCPNGHQSGSDDWCEVCGHRMAGAVPPPPPPPPPGGGYGFPPPGGGRGNPEPELCPQCRTPREGGAPFCEECRWNFLTNTATSYTPAAPRPSSPGTGGPNFQRPSGPPPSFGGGDSYEYQGSRPSQMNRPAEPIPPGPPGSPFGGDPGPSGPPGPPGGPGGPGHPGPSAFGGDPSRPVPPPPGPTPHAGPGGPGGPGGPSGFGGPGGPGGPGAGGGAPQAFQQPPGQGGPGGPGPQGPPPPPGFPQDPNRPQPGGAPGASPFGDDDWVLSPPSGTNPGGPGGPGGPGAPGGYGYPQPGATQAPPGPAAPQRPATWLATIGPDRDYFMSMMQRSGPEAAGLNLPAYSPEQQRTLSGNQVTIGRRRHSTGETPDIDLSVPPEDPGVSHQHAVLVQQPDGTWAIVDQNSTNGTTVNGSEEPIQPFVPVPLQDGDRVHVGAWTTITIRRG
ncbi:FHA domain-containing protein [Streptomyces sp. NPDC006997]|uniref:FHA domain-containing protein n=1 Tax=Streptomyces sp. NPDC006997 TaxID=3155356 RepID=UPI0033EDA05F